MQIFYKMVASFLSVALIFTSAAPSFAQGLRTHKAGFRVSASNSLEEAFTRQLAKAQQQSEEEYWVGRGEVLAGEISKKDYWKGVSSKLLEASNQVNGRIEQAVICSADDTECIPALAYAWGALRRGIKDEQLYWRGQIIDSVAPDVAWIVSSYGIYGEPERKVAVRYFYDLIKRAKEDCANGAFEYGSSNHRADQRIASERQAKRCATEIAVIPALAMISKGAAEEQKAAQTFYDLLEDKYNTAVGGAVIEACVTGLGVLGTPKAYSLLKTFLTEDTIPSTTGNVFAGIGSPFQSLAQNGLRVASNIRGGNSRYLNRINENLQYLDKQEAKRQGFQTTSWQGEGIQYPYANVLEEVGAFLGQQSASNTYARALAKELVGQANEAVKTQTNAAGVMHYPLVLGIMDGWRAHGKKFIYEPTPELINFFYKGDWFDINEGTQQRVHYKAYQFAKARGWTPELPKRDQAKIQRTIYNSRLLTIGGAGDSVLTVLMTGYLVKSIPALLRGIPQGVKILSSHRSWVGAANYFKNAPKAMWTRVKGGPRAQEIALKPATSTRASTTTPKTRTTQTTAQQPAKPAGQNTHRQGYTTVDMGTQNGQRTIGVAFTPKQETALLAKRADIAPKTFANTGDGTAPGKPLSNAKQSKTDKFQQKTQRQQHKRIYKEAEEMMQPVQTAPAKPRTLSWKDKIRFQWAVHFKPAFQNMFKFGTSRYGLAALGPGAAPLTSEAAVARAGNAVEVVQNIRTQQGMFIMEDALRGGAGASYRTGAVNSGGVAAAHYAQAALNAANPTTQAAHILALGLGATRTVQAATSRYGSGMAYSLLFPVPSFMMNRLLQARMPAEDGTESVGSGNATSAEIYNKVDPFGIGKFTITLGTQPQVSPSTTNGYDKSATDDLIQAEQEIQNTLRENLAAQAASQQRLEAQLAEIEREWAEEEDIYNSMRQTSAAQAAGQQRLSQELDAAEQALLEQEMWAQEEADLNAAMAQTSAAMGSSQARLDAALDAAEAELEQEKQAAKTRQAQAVGQSAQVTLASLEQAISQFIELSMPFFLFEKILQNIFTGADAKMTALANSHQRGRRPGYASLWLKAAQELGYAVKDLGLVKLAKDKQSPLLPLFKLREEAQKSAPDKQHPHQEPQLYSPQTELSTPAQEKPVNPDGNQLRTGIEGLNVYLPNWRAQLAATKAGFSRTQLDAIKNAFAATDQLMFAKDKNGNLIYNPTRGKEAWNYAEVFELILGENQVPLTKRQFGQIFGGKGIDGFTLKNYFTLLNLTAFLTAYDRLPQKVSAATAQERSLRADVDKVRSRGKVQGITTTDPIMRALGVLTDTNRVRRDARTPDQVLLQLKQYMQQHNGQYPAYHAPAGSVEASLNNAISDAIDAAKKNGTAQTDPVIVELNQIKEENRQFDIHKTALKWYAALQQWFGAHNNKLPSKYSAVEQERQLRNGIDNTLATAKRKGVLDTDEAVVALKQLHDQHKGKRDSWSTQQIYDELVKYLSSHKQMPPDGSQLYYTISSRLYNHKKTNKGHVDSKGNFVYADPWLQKIYELKLALQAAPTGKFTITPDGKGGYILEIAPEALQEIATEETGTAKAEIIPTHHSIRLRINEQVKQAMENAQEQDVLERRNFSQWVWAMNSVDYRDLLINRETSDALYNIASNVKADAKNNIARLKVTYLVNMLNNIRKVLKNSTAQTYYKLIYRGTVAKNKLPVATNFHVVAEEKRIDRQEQVAKRAQQFLAEHPELGVFIDERNNNYITRIGFKKGIAIEQAANDLKALIAQLTPAGYVYRMGKHELGLFGNKDSFRHGNVHLHLESIATEPTEDGLFVDISLTLDIGAWRFAGWYNKNKEFEPYFDNKIAANYQKLFAPYLNEEGKQALSELAAPAAATK